MVAAATCAEPKFPHVKSNLMQKLWYSGEFAHEADDVHNLRKCVISVSGGGMQQREGILQEKQWRVYSMWNVIPVQYWWIVTVNNGDFRRIK